MINNLITAYRFQFYDLTKERRKSFFLKNWPLLLFLAMLFLVAIIVTVCSLIFKKLAPMTVVLIAELVILIITDRRSVKRYRAAILSRENHLNDVITFLQTVVPDHNFYTAEQIDEIIQRLTSRIDERAPFKTVEIKMFNFGKSIILPAVTCVVGAYASIIAGLDIRVVIMCVIAGILLLATLYMAWELIQNALRKIICRDYDAAIALREDLQDIKLMFFAADSKARP